MMLTAPDCLSVSGALSLSSTRTVFRDKCPSLFGRFNLNLEKNPTRLFRGCKASLITNSESFEVGRLIGSYGFMNITSFSGLQLGFDGGYSSGDVGHLRVQDVGEGNVKISFLQAL